MKTTKVIRLNKSKSIILEIDLLSTELYEYQHNSEPDLALAINCNGEFISNVIVQHDDDSTLTCTYSGNDSFEYFINRLSYQIKYDFDLAYDYKAVYYEIQKWINQKAKQILNNDEIKDSLFVNKI